VKLRGGIDFAYSIQAPGRRLDFTVSRRFDVEVDLLRQGNAIVGVAALLGIFIAMPGVAVAQDDKDAKEDTVQVHGKSLTLSCAEWKRNQDGSWTSTGPLLVGTDTVNNVTLRGAKETNGLEAKCGSGAAPAAKPSQSEDTTKHGKHRHHSGEPGDGT
jgi:hypothetical protein